MTHGQGWSHWIRVSWIHTVCCGLLSQVPRTALPFLAEMVEPQSEERVRADIEKYGTPCRLKVSAIGLGRELTRELTRRTPSIQLSTAKVGGGRWALCQVTHMIEQLVLQELAACSSL
jgi:hypothetical protein